MTKTKKTIMIAVAAIALIAVGCVLYFTLGSSAGDIQTAEGEIYRTETESFWVGVGKAYMSFQHKEEPQNKTADDKELYGDVFYVMVSSGDSYDPWLSGHWSLDEANGKLMLTAEWDEAAENVTKLADAEPGVEKVYSAENGEYRIPVELPSASVTFVLNPVNDKVGSGIAKTEDAEAEEADESTGDLFARLAAQDSLFDGAVKGYAQLDMAKDKTWVMKIKVDPYVPSYVKAVSGSWSENDDGSLTLNVTGGEYANALSSPFTIKKSNDGKYSGTVRFTADKANGIVFSFAFYSISVNSDPSANPSSGEKPEQPAPTADGELYRTPIYHGIYSGIVGDAYISFLGTGDFEVYVNAGEGYSSWLSGKWALNKDNTKLELTQNSSTDSGLTGAKAGQPKTYTADKNGVFRIDTYFPSGGTARFEFKPSRDAVGSSPEDPTPTPTPEPTTPPAGKDDIVLKAHDDLYDGAITCDAVLSLKPDKTWNLQTTVYGNTVDSAASGKWKEKSDKSLELTVKNKFDGAELPDSFKLNYNEATDKYSGTVKLTCNGEFTFTLRFEGGKGAETSVKVTGIKLDKQSLSLSVGESATLTATVSPNDASNKSVEWSSTDESVAGVAGGKVTAKAAGTAVITATTKDGGFSASCKITVAQPAAGEEHYIAKSSSKCNGFPMSLQFDNGSFKLNVDTIFFDASEWFFGTYSFNADKSELTLNSNYNPNGPHLEAAEATGGGPVTLKSDNGTFNIVVKDPSQSGVNGTFTLTVGSGSQQQTSTAKYELFATDSGGSAKAKLCLNKDTSFRMLVDTGDGYKEVASGTWRHTLTLNIVLTVKDQAVQNSLPKNINLEKELLSFHYSGSVSYTAGSVTYNFAFASNK